MSVLSHGENVIDKFEFVRSFAYRPSGAKMFKTGDSTSTIYIKEFIINDGDFDLADQSGFYLFDYKAGQKYRIGKFTLIGTGGNKYRLQNGGTTGRNNFVFDTPPPANIILT